MLTVLISGCTTDPGGHLYNVLNESQRSVVIEIATDQRQSFDLPPMSRGHLSGSFASPGSDWVVIVRTDTCVQIAAISLANQPSRLTLRVTPAGDVVVGDETLFSLQGKTFPIVSPLPPGSCGSAES